MKIEFKNKDKSSFKAGDIIAFKVDDNLNKSTKTHYYLIGLYYDNGNDYDYYLTNIRTGIMAKLLYDSKNMSGKKWFSKNILTNIIKAYDGKVYREDKAKLILEKNN